MNFNDFKLQYGQFKCCRIIEEAMFDSCCCGDLSMCQLIAEKFPNIDIHKRVNSDFRDYIFRINCEKNHLEIAQWLKTTWPAIDHTIRNHAAIKHCLNYNRFTKDGSKSFLKWLIRLYDIDSIDEPINIFFECENEFYIKYIIKYFDIQELQIDAKYQTAFNDMINEYQNNRCCVKSARK